ncbi:hypothetical protein DS832_07125 [Bombilactobacillus bombi]|uniref:Helix-turn-helix domain-containing protein n=1 Tax=Bombilactobacillus bombi TaxID=1303590 RepID=A0A417Z681_9LACO|nr:helix-turn-helix domain-containing protein [Bombilactobacillus bombi]RHW46114.1 hypothetical protein DS832_07125 [Bombilactobacillus bombi]
MTDQPNYYSILPASVRYCDKISDFGKLLFSEITALSNKNGYCTASNMYFANLYKKDKSTIQRQVTKLKNAGFLKVEHEYAGKQIKSRRIYPIVDSKNSKVGEPMRKNKATPSDTDAHTPISKNAHTPMRENAHYPIGKNEQDNITSINTTSINNKPLRSKSKNRTYEPDDPNYKLAKYLLEKIRETSPQVYPTDSKNQPKLQSWANDIRLMHERDKRSYGHIKKMIDWCQDDDFWHRNILSAAALRKQYGKMAVQANEDSKLRYRNQPRFKEPVTDYSQHKSKAVDPQELARLQQQWREFKNQGSE